MKGKQKMVVILHPIISKEVSVLNGLFSLQIIAKMCITNGIKSRDVASISRNAPLISESYAYKTYLCLLITFWK